MKWNIQWTLNKRLAATALCLGFLALIAGNPHEGGRYEIDSRELSLIVDKGIDHVGALELADWIIQNKADYRLIDLRSEKEFNEYNIPTSENTTLTALETYPILRNEKIVLYSDGGIHSAQAWFLLRAKGYKGVYILRGGLEEWKDQILFPRIAENASKEELAAFERIKEISKFFGGTPQTGSNEAKSDVSIAMPKLEMKTPAKQGTTARKKKKEGC